MRVTRLSADHLHVPPARPGRVSLTDPLPPRTGALDLFLVHLETDAGLTGLGFSYLPGPGAAAVRALLDTELPALVVGADPRQTDVLLAKVEGYFRAAGFAGLAARAYAAVDVALWDLKAKAAGVPLFQLLGGVRAGAPFFVSDVPPDVENAKPFVKQGAKGVRLEVGWGEMQSDAHWVGEISGGLGNDAWVGVTAEGRLDLTTAQALAHFFEDIGVDWFEDPLPAADEVGYARLAGLGGVPIAVGAGFGSREAFFRVIRAGQVRTVRPDVCRLGGITPVLKVAAVAEAFQVAVSPVRLPEVGVHLACGLAVVPHVDSVSWFKDVFAGGPRVEDGKLVPPAEPGLGQAVSPDALAKWRAGGPG